MRCQMCQKKFATQEVGWTTSEVTDQQDPPLGSTPYTPATAKEDSAGHASSRLNSSEFPADTNQTHDNVIPIARVNQSWSLFQRIMVQLPKASNLETQPSVSDLDYYKPDPATPSSLTSVLNHDYPATFIRQRLSETTYGPQIPSGLIDDLIETSGRLFLWASVVLDYLDNVFEPVGALKDILHEMHGVQDGDAASKLDHLYSHILSRLKWTDTRLVIKYRIIVGAIVTWKDPLSSSDLASLYESEGITENDVQKICLLIRPLLRDYSSTRPHEHLRLIHLSVQEYLTERAPTPYRISVHRGDPSLRP
ncbi:hypothetical protein FA15DRAFT_73494 [Coprinopsis marcescibilis]|uniref:Uncharacterized protein n=1 Tax=Coprinopsis marcescibilis TaxID=230819 RepID=A0A5C3L831_COPMA|nr:hypothetical protein FA15DRAFT_73494 [Coprinopsis marcescibilis]